MGRPVFLRYRCWDCKKTFLADVYRTVGPSDREESASWAIYHHVALRLSYEDVTLSLNDLFGFSFGSLSSNQAPMAGKHRATYERMKQNSEGA